MRIEKKVWPKYFELIKAGKKSFEVRLADFDVEEGDILVLREWDPDKKAYTGRVLEKKVVYVTKARDWKFWPNEAVEKYGYQVIGLEMCSEGKNQR